MDGKSKIDPAMTCIQLGYSPESPEYILCAVCVAGIDRCITAQGWLLFTAGLLLVLILLPCFYCCCFSNENPEFRKAFEGTRRHATY